MTQRKTKQSLDLLLDEDRLIALAMREMRGRRPPSSFENSFGPDLAEPLQPLHPEKPCLLAREMKARGWDTQDISRATGLHPAEVNALVHRRMRITQTIAETLARAFATSPDLWLSGEM